MPKTRFKRAGSTRTSELDDNRGRITISIRRTEEGGRVVKGNVTRTISVADSTVYDVADAISDALFDGNS